MKLIKEEKTRKNKEVTFLQNIERKPLVKKATETEEWKKNIYGFECANFTTKC